jgi:threonine 3-dehydrogenase
MKALVKKEPKVGLWMEDIPVPKIGLNDVLIRIQKTSICGTDIHIFNWDDWAARTIKPPMTIGHEFVGVVEKIGRNVHDFKPGDLVSGEGHVVCGRCRNCLAGRRHLCKDPKSVGVNRDGAFAEYLAIPVTNVWYCDPNIPMDVLSCFDPLGNAAHTALSFDLVGEDVLITGAGPIGSMAVAVAKHAGARHVVITDVNPYRLELAKKMGATRAVDVRREKDALSPVEGIENIVKELQMKEGFDVGLEMSGNPDAFRSMLANMCHGGKIALLGILPPMSINWDYIVFNGLTIKGIYGREMYETWYKVTMLIQCGMDISPLITHHFHYTEYMKGFEVMRSGQSGKVILDWS